MYAIINDIFEPGAEAPVVRHIFTGRTKKEAEDYFRAHRSSDSFLRECVDRGTFQGRVTCPTRTRSLTLSPTQAKALVQGQFAGQTNLGAQKCPVSFWRFALPVALGNFAALGARYVAKRTIKAEHEKTQETAANMIGIATFWLVGGLGWVAFNRRAVTS